MGSAYTTRLCAHTKLVTMDRAVMAKPNVMSHSAQRRFNEIGRAGLFTKCGLPELNKWRLPPSAPSPPAKFFHANF